MCVFALQVTAALCVMFKVEEVESVVQEMFPRFFADLLLRIGASTELQLADPKRKEKQPTATQYVTHKIFDNTNESLENPVSFQNFKKHVLFFNGIVISLEKALIRRPAKSLLSACLVKLFINKSQTKW